MSRSALLGTLMLACLPAAGNIVIDFNDLADHDPVWSPDRYIDQGVRFTTNDDAELRFASTEISGILSPFVFGSEGFGADSDLIVDFVDGPTNFVGFSAIDQLVTKLGVWSARIYGEDGALLDQIESTVNAPDGSAFFIFERSDFDIHRFVFTPSIENEGLDNLTFNIVPTPSSSSALLLLGCFITRRSR